MNARKTGTPAFDVWFTPVGREDHHNLRTDIRREVDAAVAALERRGCAAAHYRLAGADSDIGRVCVVHPSRDWRLILGFRAEHEVAVLLILLGEDVLKAFLLLKRHEWDRFNRHVTDWEIQEYLPHH